MAKKRKGITSPSSSRLDQKNIAYELVTFDAVKRDTDEAAQMTGMPLSQTVKTLLMVGKVTGHFLVLCPGDREVTLKKLGIAIEDKKIKLADPKAVIGKTGCYIGGLGPLATRRPFPVVVDNSILKHDRIIINAGQPGYMLKMDPNDLVKAIDKVIFVDDIFH